MPRPGLWADKDQRLVEGRLDLSTAREHRRCAGTVAVPARLSRVHVVVHPSVSMGHAERRDTFGTAHFAGRHDHFCMLRRLGVVGWERKGAY